MDISNLGSNPSFSTDIESIDVVVNPVNDAPTINATDQTTKANSTLIHTLGAIDIDNDLLTYTLDTESFDKGMTVTPEGELNWTPNSDQVGNHAVIVTVSDSQFSVEGTFNITVEVDADADKKLVTGITETSPIEVTIYPNPTTDYVEINPGLLDTTYQVLLYDLNGQIANTSRWFTKDGNLELNLSHLDDGIYILNLQSNTTTITQRIIKQ